MNQVMFTNNYYGNKRARHIIGTIAIALNLCRKYFYNYFRYLHPTKSKHRRNTSNKKKCSKAINLWQKPPRGLYL